MELCVPSFESKSSGSNHKHGNPSGIRYFISRPNTCPAETMKSMERVFALLMIPSRCCCSFVGHCDYPRGLGPHVTQLSHLLHC